jgi:hypothetical protein
MSGGTLANIKLFAGQSAVLSLVVSFGCLPRIVGRSVRLAS